MRNSRQINLLIVARPLIEQRHKIGGQCLMDQQICAARHFNDIRVFHSVARYYDASVFIGKAISDGWFHRRMCYRKGLYD